MKHKIKLFRTSRNIELSKRIENYLEKENLNYYVIFTDWVEPAIFCSDCWSCGGYYGESGFYTFKQSHYKTLKEKRKEKLSKIKTL